MANARPWALVTAPVRGPGSELLAELADLVVDPWIEHTPLRIYNAEQLAERAAAEGATILVVEADQCAGPVFELPGLLAVASCRGEPNNVDVPAATAAGIPVFARPGSKRRCGGQIAVALLLAASRGVAAADADVRAGGIYRDGTIPYQRYRAWADRRAHGRAGRARGSGSSAALAPPRPRYASGRL